MHLVLRADCEIPASLLAALGSWALILGGLGLMCPTMETRSTWASRCHRIADSARFHTAILAVILFNAVLVGIETSPGIVARAPTAFAVANWVILAVFVCELAIRIAAVGGRWGTFLRDGWNVFDVVVVALSLLPGVGAFATTARIARVLRVARLVSVSPKLRLIIGTMTRSIPSLAHVSLLLSLLLYLYAVIGVNLFGPHDPEHWQTLGRALLTLFQIITLEGWVEIQRAVLQPAPWAWFYFASFVIIAVFVVVNLFIAVVLNNLDEVREEDRRAAEVEQQRRNPGAATDFDQQLATVRVELERLEALYRRGRGAAPPT